MEQKQYTTEEILEMLKKASSKSLLKFITDRVKEDESLRQALGQYLDQPSTKTFNAKDFEDKILKAWNRAIENAQIKWHSYVLWDTELIEKFQHILQRVSKESQNSEMRITLQLKLLGNIKIRKGSKWEIFRKILENVIQDFRKILETSQEAEGHLIIRKYLFDTCLTHLRRFKVLTNELENRGELESFIIETFTEEFSEEIKKYIDMRIQSILSSDADADSWDKEDWLKDYVEKMLNLLSRTNASENVLLSYAYEYWEFQNVRRWLISFYKKSTQWDKAIMVIEDSLLKEGKLPNKSTYYRKELKELYLLNDDNEKYREILLEEIKEFQGEMRTEMKKYRELKSLYPQEEWLKVREHIFASKVTNYEILAQYFLEDNLHQRLSKLLLAEDTKYAFFDKYASTLPDEYGELILSKYEKHFKNLFLKAHGRIQYQELMNTLKDAHKIPGGKELTERLTTEWLKKYETRPALCEEITKFQNEYKSKD